MANRFLGEATATAGGKTWTMRFDMNVLGNLERLMGKPAMSILEEMDKGQTPVETRRMICHQMLIRHQPQATMDDAGDILSEDAEAFFAVLKGAMPEQGSLQPGKPHAKASESR